MYKVGYASAEGDGNRQNMIKEDHAYTILYLWDLLWMPAIFEDIAMSEADVPWQLRGFLLFNLTVALNTAT